MSLATVVLLLVTLQRLSELVIAHHNTKALLANGAKETGAAHYPLIVVTHALWLAGLWYFARNNDVNLILLAAFALLQGLRLWVLATLGRRWTTRIITVPGETLESRGPFKFISHPNYAVVALEMPLLPLVFGLTWFAIVFGLTNLAILAMRISVENRALGR